MDKSTPITIEITVDAPIDKIWDAWSKPDHIVHWAFASDDWEASHAENDLHKGGRFKTVMGAKDQSVSFDFVGTYTEVIENKIIEYDIDDGRHVRTVFEEKPEGVKIVQTFDPEHENTAEMQRSGWTSILDNFKKYVEGSQK